MSRRGYWGDARCPSGEGGSAASGSKTQRYEAYDELAAVHVPTSSRMLAEGKSCRRRLPLVIEPFDFLAVRSRNAFRGRLAEPPVQ